MGFLQAFQQTISFLTWTHQTSTIPLSSNWPLNHDLCGKMFSIHSSFMYTHTTHTHTSPLRTCGAEPQAPMSRGSSGRDGAVEQGAGTLGQQGPLWGGAGDSSLRRQGNKQNLGGGKWEPGVKQCAGSPSAHLRIKSTSQPPPCHSTADRTRPIEQKPFQGSTCAKRLQDSRPPPTFASEVTRGCPL